MKKGTKLGKKHIYLLHILKHIIMNNKRSGVGCVSSHKETCCFATEYSWLLKTISLRRKTRQLPGKASSRSIIFKTEDHRRNKAPSIGSIRRWPRAKLNKAFNNKALKPVACSSELISGQRWVHHMALLTAGERSPHFARSLTQLPGGEFFFAIMTP